jgi:hypothetical protein
MPNDNIPWARPIVRAQHVEGLEMTHNLIGKSNTSVVHFGKSQSRSVSKVGVREDGKGAISTTLGCLMQRRQERSVEAQQAWISFRQIAKLGSGKTGNAICAPGIKRMTMSGMGGAFSCSA